MATWDTIMLRPVMAGHTCDISGRIAEFALFICMYVKCRRGGRECFR